MDKGILVVISGFSGAGKGTIMKELIRSYDYFLSVSATMANSLNGPNMSEIFTELRKSMWRSS